ncbi:MAG: Gldg family protein [Phycisphaerales bacterium]|nr:MAG: Gldg family protein [Phycisphaerales bacterium]
MAIDKQPSGQASKVYSAGRRMLIGVNVIIAIVLAGAIVAVMQAFAYSAHRKVDMTLSGVNSLSEGTENLLRSLDKNVRLTSLYFETDLEERDQQRYRRTAEDLLGLYESTNRSKVTADWINPLSDHDKFKEFTKRLRESPASKKAIDTYAERINKYTDELDARMRAIVEQELQAIASTTEVAMGEQTTPESLARVEFLLMRWRDDFGLQRENVDALMPLDNPQYAAVTNIIKDLYRNFASALNNISDYGQQALAQIPSLPENQASFLRGASDRYTSILADVEAEGDLLGELEPIKSDEILSELVPTGNAIVVETDEDALVVDFSSVWPPLNEQDAGRQVKFEDRAFKGEEKVTAAILRVTHKEQTAVVFVRYGGPPPFMGGFMPGQPPAPYTTMKRQLEDANFVVEEWDLKSSVTPPEIDPAPTKTIYVVLKPTPPPRGQFGQQSQEPPFGQQHKRVILDAIGDNGRAIFIAGWTPGPIGPMPSSYEYNEYLKETWGINVDTSALLVEASEYEPGKYNVMRQDFFNMEGLDVTDHDIVNSSAARQLVLPWCAPLELSEPLPEGVEHAKLASLPAKDGLWGIKQLHKYQEQFRERKYLTKEPEDLEGPYDLAVAATRGNAKIVVVSSREFAMDSAAFAKEFSLGPQGFVIRSRNPGNVTLFVNSLHWLNDNTEFMNIGQPIDVAVLEIESKSDERFVQVLATFIWPALALCCGGVAWWVRRR